MICLLDPKKLLVINQSIEIQKKEDFDNDPDKYYASRIEDINEKGIVIGTPIEKSVLVDLRPNSTVIIWLNEAIASYALFCRVRARIYEPLPLTFLDWPHDIQRIQRRNYVRVPASLQIEFSTGEKDAEGKEIFHSALTGDISGGGLNFTTSVKLSTKDPLKIILHLPGQEEIVLEGKITWIVHQSHNRYFVGIKFMKISEGIREHIIKYIFIRQRDLIRKGVLQKPNSPT